VQFGISTSKSQFPTLQTFAYALFRRLSTTVTEWPAERSCGTRTDPRYPAPPVTRIYCTEEREKRKAEHVPAGAGRVEYLEDSPKGATRGSESVNH